MNEVTTPKNVKKPSVVDQALLQLHQDHGKVDKKLFVAVARDPNHPCHSRFDWNDNTAGEKYRESQAEQMILASKYLDLLASSRDAEIPVETSNQPLVRQFLPSATNGGFQLRSEVLGNEADRAVIIERKKEALRAWCRSVVDISELDDARVWITTWLADPVS